MTPGAGAGKLRVLDLFSGIGGFSLGLERTGGFETVGFVEIDPFCRKVLAKHWPDVPQFEDVRNVTDETLRQRGIDEIAVLTGGFPCQPFSVAGKQRGSEDERYLWPEIIRLVRLLRPGYIILENVPNLLALNGGREFGIILSELAESGCNAEWEVISASAFGAPHERERLFIVAYPNQSSRQEGVGDKSIGAAAVLGREAARRDEFWLQTPDGVSRVDDGISARFYEGAVGGYGNAVVPVIPEYIGHCILAAERER
jgi:DNA (cytosine-5)-methyltransferase 1